MPFQKINFRAGLNAQRTPLSNQGGWSAANLIRFREGLPEVMGGWVAFLQSLVQGICRGLHAWTTLADIPTLGVGTNLRLYVCQNGSAFDVTPIAQTTTPTAPFTTASGNMVVTVSDSGLTAALTVGSFVEISGGSAIGGLTLAGEYAVQSVLTSTSYTINAASNATSTATGGGTPTISYLLPAGLSGALPGAGWGIGTWGTGTWGTPRSSSQGTTLPRIWTIDNFGELMIACPRGGGIFQWVPANGVTTRALAITNAPTQCNAIFVSNAAEQIIALGATPAGGGAFNPMLVAWCDNGNTTVWAASSTNAAGSFPLTAGSQLMWGCRAAQQNLLWTDTALYSMIFIGGTLIYAFNQLGTGCGLLAPNGAVVSGSVAFWISGLNFYWYNGTVQALDCPVWDAVYRNLNFTQSGRIFCGLNSQFSEIRWDYPSLNATENDSYVIFNFADRTWTLGGNALTGISVSRTAWIDYNVFGNPIAFDAAGASWSHEVGYSAGPLAMPWFLQSGEIDISNGEDIMFVDRILPDQVLSGGPVAITVYAQRYSGDPVITDVGDPFQVTPATEFIIPRLRARQMALRFDNSFMSTGVFWRLGAVRVRAAPDGRN